MKKILFILTAITVMVACNKEKNGLLFRGSETGRFPYQTIRQSYDGDTLETTVGDTIDYTTSADFYNFDKPIRILGNPINTTATVGDTIEFTTGSQIRRGTNSIELFPFNAGGYYAQVWWVDDYVSVNSSRFNLNITDTSLQKYGGEVAYDGDKFYGYNGTDWIEFSGGGGTGTVDVNGTPLNGQITVFHDANTIKGNSNFIYRNDSLTADVLDYLSLGVVGSSGFLFNSDSSWMGGGSNYIVIRDGQTDIQSGADGLHLKDSVYLENYENKTPYGYVYRDSISGVLKIDSSVISSSFGLKMYKDVEELLSDTLNGEIAWYVSKDKKVYDLNQIPMNERIGALQAMQEMTLQVIRKQNERIAELEKIKGIEKSPIQTSDKIYIGLIAFLLVLLIVVAISKSR